MKSSVDLPRWKQSFNTFAESSPWVRHWFDPRTAGSPCLDSWQLCFHRSAHLYLGLCQQSFFRCSLGWVVSSGGLTCRHLLGLFSMTWKVILFLWPPPGITISSVLWGHVSQNMVQGPPASGPQSDVCLNEGFGVNILNKPPFPTKVILMHLEFENQLKDLTWWPDHKVCVLLLPAMPATLATDQRPQRVGWSPRPQLLEFHLWGLPWLSHLSKMLGPWSTSYLPSA